MGIRAHGHGRRSAHREVTSMLSRGALGLASSRTRRGLGLSWSGEVTWMLARGALGLASSRTGRGIAVSWSVLFILSLLLQYGTFALAPAALAVHDEGLFELDGNAVSGAVELEQPLIMDGERRRSECERPVLKQQRQDEQHAPRDGNAPPRPRACEPQGAPRQHPCDLPAPGEAKPPPRPRACEPQGSPRQHRCDLPVGRPSSMPMCPDPHDRARSPKRRFPCDPDPDPAACDEPLPRRWRRVLPAGGR